MPDRPFSRPAPPGACDLRVGTSGYSYTEWVEAGFYPPGTQTGQMLPLYARHFSCTELNHTWYQLPKAETLELQRRSAPPDFGFAAKLTRTLTHEIDPAAWRGQALAFRQGVAPLLQARQLAAVLAQFPPAFERSASNRQYLAALLAELAGLPLAVEFRSDTWLAEKVYAELARRRVTLVTVDEPALPGLLPPLDVVTNPDLFYVRFHGRNVRGWRAGHPQSQFDYAYAAAELREWAEGRIARAAEQARRGLIFFNNHVRAQSVRDARALAKLLAGRGLEVR